MSEQSTVQRSDVDPATVRAAYRLILGREPENDAAVRQCHGKGMTVRELSEAFLRSPEFAERWARLPGVVQRGNLLEQPMEVELEASKDTLARLFAHVAECWAKLGAESPYWSVLTAPQFKGETLTPGLEKSFFASGERNVDQLKSALARTSLTIPHQGTCFELGCGVGRVTRWLAREFATVMAADISAPHLALAKSNLAGADVHNVLHSQPKGMEYFDALPEFDAFYSVLVLQHNPPPIIHAMLRKILQRLRPGGWAYFQVPVYFRGYRYSIEERLAKAASVKAGAQMEMHVLPQPALMRLIAECNCIPLEVREGGGVSRPDNISNTLVVQRTFNSVRYVGEGESGYLSGKPVD